jgi:carbonic anhydrase/acetyltransferase-like protein (isoleucine patch superfamily)
MTDNSSKSVRPNPNGDMPVVDPTAYIDPTAQVIGNVKIGANVYVGPFAVIRSDETDENDKVHAIEIADECNVQDGVIIHALSGTPVTVGKRTVLGHGCIVHGPCQIGDGCFVGFRAVVFKSVLGNDSFVGAGAVVQGVDMEANSLTQPAEAVLSNEDAAKLAGKAGDAEHAFVEKIINANLKLTKGYLKTRHKGTKA